jgi:hypothetical protein
MTKGSASIFLRRRFAGIPKLDRIAREFFEQIAM